MDCRPASIEQLQLEITQDGYFHLGLWLVLLLGTAMLFGAARRAGPEWNGRVLLGSMLAGCGLFNFVEGLVNHQILGIHLGNGLLFAVMGVWLIRSPTGSAD